VLSLSFLLLMVNQLAKTERRLHGGHLHPAAAGGGKWQQLGKTSIWWLLR
jgi:hypothetical protein